MPVGKTIRKAGDADMDRSNIPVWEKTTLTLSEAAEYTNIGINKLREITNDPKCTFVLYVGKKRLIKRKELEKYISRSLEL